jgi:hypothetical protein
MITKGIVDNIDKEWLGAQVAIMSDFDQIAFFKGFIGEMMKWDTRWQGEQQLFHINKGLNSFERNFIANLGYDGED